MQEDSKITDIKDFQDKKATEIHELKMIVPVAGYDVEITGEYLTKYGAVQEWNFFADIKGETSEGVFHIVTQRALFKANRWMKEEKEWGEIPDD